MRARFLKIIYVVLLLPFISKAQDSLIIKDYINTYKDIAIKEMQRTGVPASIKLAQGIHETTAGTSELVLKSNNHFGIKCKNTWLGASVSHDDDLRGECFRKYSSAIDSYKDHSDFLKNSNRYSFLFKLDPTDYKDWAYGLKKAGYATNPRYPQVLIKLIEDYHLQDYTLIAMGKAPVFKDDMIAITDSQKTEPAPTKEITKIDVVIKIEKTPEKNTAFPLPGQPVYPEGEFKINDTKVIYAKKGTSFLAIAQEYEIHLAKLFEFNDIEKGEVVNKDQLIYIQRKRKMGMNEFHIVRQGETLSAIAQLEAIRLETLLEYNHLRSGMNPAVGEKLYLRKKAETMPQLALKENYSLYLGTSK